MTLAWARPRDASLQPHTRPMHLESVAMTPKRAECDAVWLPADPERWLAHLAGDDLDEPVELVFYCRACVKREFAD